jgi:hypothetical protein
MTNPQSPPSPTCTITLDASDLAILTRVADLLEQRQAEDARALRRCRWVVALSLLELALATILLVLLATGWWT